MSVVQLTAVMPLIRFAHGPTPVTAVVENASNKRAATGPGLRPVRQPARRYESLQAG